MSGSYVSAPLRRVARSIRDGTHGTFERVADGRPLLSAKNIRDGSVVVGDDESRISDSDYGEICRTRRFEAGDVLLTIVGAIGRVAILGDDDPRAFQRSVAAITPSTSASSRYLAYVFQGSAFQEQLAGVTRQSAQGGVYLGDLANMQIPVHPTAVQDGVVTFLDAETARIDALVAKKQQMIELMTERRREFVARAVTVGLDEHEPTTMTGNPFAPMIPRSWSLQRLRHVALRIIDTAHKTAPVVPDGEYLVVRTSNVKNGQLVLDGARYTDEATWRDWTLQARPRPDDVMFTREAPAGEACLVPKGIPLCIGQRMVLIQVDQSLASGEWLVHSIYAGPAQQFVGLLSRSTTVAHLNMSDIPDMPVVVPPLDVQGRILDEIRAAISHQEGSTSLLMKQIHLLREYRRALITAAVTGEIDIPVVGA